jgi:hypothetical protein
VKSPPIDKVPHIDAPKAVKLVRGRGSAARCFDRPTSEDAKTKNPRKKGEESKNPNEDNAGARQPPSWEKSPPPDKEARPTSDENKSKKPRKKKIARHRNRTPPKASEPLHDPKLEDQTRKPRHGRERTSSAKVTDANFVPLYYIDRDQSQCFQIGPPASFYRGHSATLGRLGRIPNSYPLCCAQCNCVFETNRIATVCHSCDPTFITCLDSTCNLLERPVSTD